MMTEGGLTQSWKGKEGITIKGKAQMKLCKKSDGCIVALKFL